MSRIIGKIGAFLRSSTLTVWLIGLFVLYYLTMAIWMGEAFSRYVDHLSSNTFFRTFFLLFLANVVLRISESVRKMRGRWLLLSLRLPLLIGLVLALAAFFLSLNFRQHQWTQPLGEGDLIELPWERELIRVVRVQPAISKRALRSDEAKIFDYEPGITVVGRDGMQHEVGAFPPRRVGRSYLHVLTFGLGPGIELQKNREVLWRGYTALRLVPFGAADTFSIPGQPYKFYLSVVPTSIMKKGRETARTYDLERPRYLVEIAQGDRVLARDETESRVSFDGDMELSFFEPSDWVIVEAVRDPFLPWFSIGLMIFGTGIVLYPFSFLLRRGLPDRGTSR